jgi:hypothetical protein
MIVEVRAIPESKPSRSYARQAVESVSENLERAEKRLPGRYHMSNGGEWPAFAVVKIRLHQARSNH